jgi:hypothetical protein
LPTDPRDKAYKLMANYGLTTDDFEAMLEVQSYACAICDLQEDKLRDDGTPFPLSVDHCHVTGRIRGLLCHRCNTALGLFRDDPALLSRAIEYLSLSRPRDSR